MPRTAVGWFFVGSIYSTWAHQRPDPQAFRRVAWAMNNAVLNAPAPRRLYHFALAHAAKALVIQPVRALVRSRLFHSVSPKMVCICIFKMFTESRKDKRSPEAVQ